MIAMVKPDPNKAPVSSRRLRKPGKFACMPRGRLFDQHVFAICDRAMGDFCKAVVQRCDDHD